MKTIQQRILNLIDGRGWYPIITIGVSNGIRAVSSDERFSVVFLPSGCDDVVLLCVEYCEWKNAVKKKKPQEV